MTGEAAQEEQLFEDRRDRIRARYLKPNGSRPASSARGLHHTALVSSDVERTSASTRSCSSSRSPICSRTATTPGPRTSSSTSATATRWRSSTCRASTSARTRRSSAGCTIWRSRSNPSGWAHLRAKLVAAGVELIEHNNVSLYFRDPDGARLELIADPLGEDATAPGFCDRGDPHARPAHRCNSYNHRTDVSAMLTEQLHGGGTVGVAARSSNAHVDLSPISFFGPGLEAPTAQVDRHRKYRPAFPGD